jgi:Fe-Mn family superoxide dismutase
MAYALKNFDSLIGLQGLTENLLKNHFTLYQGYVNNTNKLLDELSKLDSSLPEYSELRRRFGWEFNGMRLHELFFENISKTPKNISANSNLEILIRDQFGSFADFEKEIKSLTSMRGIGWVVLTYDPLARKLFNIWINEHDQGYLAGTIPLLVIDVFEHAYMVDYGLKKADYVNVIFKAIDWSVVESRLK